MSSSERGVSGVRRQALLLGLVIGTAELVGIALPAWSLYRHVTPIPLVSVEDLLSILIVTQILWWGVCAFWLTPLVLAIWKRPHDAGARGYRVSLSFPLRALFARTLFWTGAAALIGYLEQTQSGLETREVVGVVSLVFVLALTVSCFRAVWLRFIMQRLREQVFAEAAPESPFRALCLVTLTISSLTMAGVIAFIYFFLPPSLEPFLHLATLSPFALAMAIAGVLFVCFHFQKRLDGRATVAMLRRAQRLPYVLSAVHVAIWLCAGGSAIFLARRYFRIDFDDAVLMLGIVSAMSVGSSIYLALWYRDVMRPIRTALAGADPTPIAAPRTLFSMRAKLLVAFGGMMLFACGMALFWGFMQYKNLVTGFTAKQAELGLAWLRSEVQAAAAEQSEPPTPELVREVLRRTAGRNLEAGAVIYYVTTDHGELTSFGGGVMGAPPLPWYVRAQFAEGQSGGLELRAHGLAGRRGQLDVEFRDKTYHLGSLGLIYPSYRGRGEAVVRPLRELLLFFVVLFGTCAGIVVLTVSQFVRPIRTLEERAEGMARGELGQPVAFDGETDEIGRLTFAVEQMRRALSEKIRTTEEVNLDLEREVKTRTDQLIRQEKMASIGQLVAGIAHEINNPVNAIVNTVGPLEDAIASREADPETEDIGEMLRVVKRGAERTKAIVRALHNYSRTDEGGVVDIDVNRSLDESLELLRHVWRRQVFVDKDYGDVGRVRGHLGQLNQVFMNLLTNAAQAIGSARDGRISIQTRRNEAAVAITIKDNGPGIPPDVLPRIFDPFFTTKDVGEGTGLGLSIVHGIVERHGGQISVQTEPNCGTAFTITLPA
jgi:signal transduction histidine kinase